MAFADVIEEIQSSNNIIMKLKYDEMDGDIGVDFENQELNLYNNVQVNHKFCRNLTFQEITVPNNENKIFTNINSLMINTFHKKALESIISEEKNKIGLKSSLWNETINQKFESIIKSKFALIYHKIINTFKNIEKFESFYFAMHDEINSEKEIKEKQDDDIKFFEYFNSKVGITYDIWDSDHDIFTETNKKVTK